jgi:hypothetical protein
MFDVLMPPRMTDNEQGLLQGWHSLNVKPGTAAE